MEKNELLELDLWDGLGAQLQAFATGDRAVPPPHPPPAPEPKPQVGWGHVVWERLPFK
jgi:hypothetical protein